MQWRASEQQTRYHHGCAGPSNEFAAYWEAERHKSVLRLLTCGSVDDGKSTLVGRLLYDCHAVHQDHLPSLHGAADKPQEAGRGIDFASLVDGLQSEAEQGITIDVAYRFLSTERRKFIIADTPGHIEYTRNMITGASNCELAVILLDARHGMAAQTRRHLYIASLLGIRHFVLAVNKMDLVDYSREIFDGICRDVSAFVSKLHPASCVTIPISALDGDNIAVRSRRMPWYEGPILIQHLETVPVEARHSDRPFRMPVQRVNRPHSSFRGYSGTISSGRISTGDKILVSGTGSMAVVKRILNGSDEVASASAGDCVTITLQEEVDIGRGDTLAARDAPPCVAEELCAHVVCLSTQSLHPGRSYILKCGTKSVHASIRRISHKIEMSNLGREAARVLEVNEIGLAEITLSEPLAFDPYCDNRSLGSFILIDRMSFATVGAGMIEPPLHRQNNVQWQSFEIKKDQRAGQKRQKPLIVWFTGLSGAGKSTVANAVEKKLYALGCHTYMLDGDNLRHGLNRDLAFSEPDRVENVRRAAEVSKLFVDAGLIVLVSFISPFRAERQAARALVEDDEFVEVFIDATVEECERRDVKGLYAKARAGLISNFTGIDSPYEPPITPDVRIATADVTPDQAADMILNYLKGLGCLDLSNIA